MSEKTLLAEIRDLYSSNNCEDVIEKSIGKIYKILKRSDISSAFKNSFRKKIDIPIHKIFKDRIEYFTTDYIDTLTNAYTILFILTKYLRYLEKDDLKYNVIHSECTILFTIFEFIKENGISRQTSEDYYNLIVLYDDLDNMTIKNIKLDFLKKCDVKHPKDVLKIINGERTAEQRGMSSLNVKCDVKHPKDVLKIINGERTAEQRGMLSLNVNSTNKLKSSVFYKIRRRIFKTLFIIILFLLLCVFVAFGYAMSLQFIPFLGLAVCGMFSATGIVKELANGDSDARSTLIENSTSTQNNLNTDSNLAKDSPTDAEANYNAISYVNIQLLLDKIERNLQKGYKFRNIDIARYKNIYFKEIVNNCKVENLPETTIDGYVKILNSLLNDMYNAELESAISESNTTLATLQSLTQIDGIQKDSIQDFCVNLKSH